MTQTIDHATWQAPQTPPPARRKKLTRGQKWLVAGIVLVFFAVLGAATGDDDGNSGGSTGTKQLTAFDMCKESVRDHLKAPSTARFRDPFGDQAPSISGTGDGPYTVISTVDSQNGFGAMLRSSFVCTAEYMGGDQWDVTSTVG